MIFHASVVADDPRQAARAIAALWNGRAYPSPAIAPGCWVAMTGNEHGSAVEVLPRESALRLVDWDHDASRAGILKREGASHLLVSTHLDVEAVIILAVALGFHAHEMSRAPIPLIEIWIDECLVIEVMTPRVEAIYRAVATFENADTWEETTGGLDNLAA